MITRKARTGALQKKSVIVSSLRSHNLLNRPDLPAISNWFGLITLPLLGVVLGLRVARLAPSPGWMGISSTALVTLVRRKPGNPANDQYS